MKGVKVLIVLLKKTFEKRRIRAMKPFTTILVIFFSVLMTSCSTSSGKRVEKKALSYGFQSQVIVAKGFSHAVYTNSAKPNSDGILHIYLEGDGIPWQLRYFVSKDPTSKHPLMLKLMDMDEQSAAYIGRPCYNGFAEEAGCDSALWTFSRYSAKVVDAMSDAINSVKKKHSARKLHLYGHSGGGTLALLIASKRSDVETVVTLAGNIDIEQWTEWHGYTPLIGSINPAKTSPLGNNVRQVHLAGAKDKKVPPAIVLDWVRSQKRSEYFVFDDFDHNCCWEDIWEQTLDYLNNSEFRKENWENFSGFGNLSRIFITD